CAPKTDDVEEEEGKEEADAGLVLSLSSGVRSKLSFELERFCCDIKGVDKGISRLSSRTLNVSFLIKLGS
ncbi:hypothetical protein WICPIJ_005239, partial [Wickerhamomyces pijperi]